MAVEDDLTDWERLRSLTDEDIEAAIASDPDSYAIDEGELAPIQGLIFKDGQGKWRWRLLGPDGKAIADSPGSYSDRGEVDRAIRALQQAIVDGASKPKAA